MSFVFVCFFGRVLCFFATSFVFLFFATSFVFFALSFLFVFIAKGFVFFVRVLCFSLVFDACKGFSSLFFEMGLFFFFAMGFAVCC